MENPRNFRNLFVKDAQKPVFIAPKREKEPQISNLLEIFHRKSDSFFCNVQRFDLDAHGVADGEHFGRMLDEFL